ncbi:MAG: thiamine pyrophosphate-dependent enzyme, partial [Candidatus Enteromonas sp.]|nr:thiamine pyrophosphate-dependent enzyme [Candidatus Enteromonas sp.]
MEEMEKKLDQLSIGAIRALVIDEISKANSGHPGMPLDIAPAIYTLVKNHLVADPKDPSWINRDRFVLSSGHCSALLYAVLHLAGYAVSLEDLKNFRQLDSLTPGHPEFGHTAGVDATAGPLGQGIAQAVGMAIAEKAVSAEYPEGAEIMSHYTYCLCGDGCLEEGISQEAISLAGHLKLNKLILIYDENTSTLDGPTSNSLTEDEKLRFKASEWNVLEVADGNDVEAIDKAIAEAKKSASAPTMIVVHTRIGYGSPKEGSCKCHGNPLTAEEGAKAKETYAYDYPAFTVPEEVYANFAKNFAERGAKAHAAHEAAMKAYAAKHPEDYARFEKAMKGDLKEFLPEIPEFAAGSKDASRNTSGKVVAAFQAKCPFAFGGSADVAGSVKTAVPGDPGFSAEHPEAKNVNWGIREFGMGCAQNGILLHGGLRTYVGCFLVFADYMKPAIRMAAMENLPAIYL